MTKRTLISALSGAGCILAACGASEPVAITPILSPERVAASVDRQATRTALARMFADPDIRATVTPGLTHADLTGVSATAVPHSREIAKPVAVEAAPIGCGDFADWEGAQRFFYEHGGPVSDDYYLDTNEDGMACNSESDQGSDTQVFEAPPIPAGPTLLSEAPLAEYSPEQVARVRWEAFEKQGHVFEWADAGDEIRVLTGLEEQESLLCGPDVRSSLDARTNPTWTGYSHFIWLWYEDGDERGCIAVSKREHWFEMSPEDGEIAPAVATADGDRVPHGEIVWFAGGERGIVCEERYMPFGLWTTQRGLVGLSDEDVEAGLGHPIEGRDTETAETIRREGWYLVYMDGYPPAAPAVCLQVGQFRVLETPPCLHCQLGLLKRGDN